MEILPGIHKVDGVKAVNCYLVFNEKSTFIVDIGMPGDAKKIIEYIERHGKKPSDVGYIILTHADIDHVGCASELKKITGAKVAIHSEDAAILSGKQKFKTINNFLSPVVGLVIRLARYRPIAPDILLSDGSQIEGWQIIHTPGHTMGSICIFQPGKTIFVGDALRTDSDGNPRPVSRRVSLDKARVKKSLSAIATLDFETLLPGHGAPIAEGASGKIKDMVTRYARSDKTR